MADDISRDNNLMDFCSIKSLEPLVNFGVRIGSSSNKLETRYVRIEERIRKLVFVATRVRQKKSHQVQDSKEIRNFSGEILVNWDREKSGNDRINVEEKTSKNGKSFKRDSSHLVGKALNMLDFEFKNADKEGGSFYDCNLCFDMAKDPVLTCCGHMFCWLCFYLLPYVYSTIKECPVCTGEVSDNAVIPIYSNGSVEHVSEVECGLKIPPRPKARRVESFRQQGVGRSLSYASVAQALREITGAMGSQTGQQGGNGNSSLNFESHGVLNAADPQRNHALAIRPERRVLSERTAFMGSVSFALNNSGRSVEDRETVVNNWIQGSDDRTSIVGVGNYLTSYFTTLRSYNRPPESRVEINSALPISSSSQASDVSGAVEGFMTLTAIGINPPVDPSPSYWGRTIPPNASDVESEDSHESRRRRLN